MFQSFLKVLVKVLPKQPVIVKACIFSKSAEDKIDDEKAAVIDVAVIPAADAAEAHDAKTQDDPRKAHDDSSASRTPDA